MQKNLGPNYFFLSALKVPHSVLERIWIKGSYLSQWLPQGERWPPKESKSWCIEILHGQEQFFFKEQFLFSFLCIVKPKKISERSKIFWKKKIFLKIYLLFFEK